MLQRSTAILTAARRARAIRIDLGRDLRHLREDAGLSRAAVGRAARVSGSAVGRVEMAAFEPDLATLLRIASALGADVSIRLFPSGAPIRDRFQAPMLEAVLDMADRGWQRQVEVPVVGVTRGVIDCVLAHPARPLLVAVEVQSEVRRAEALLRRSTTTAAALLESPLVRGRAGGPGIPRIDISRLLVLRSTRATRAAVEELSRTFGAAFPARTTDAVAALRQVDRPWPGAAIAWVHLHGRAASVMDAPPRGVSVGR